ncbi:hypothetical protein TNCV_512201 [Trichonephila clavipes]|nr:hypothetical protein TNCV_512201 [Trichonephila clavipes]
MFSATPVGVVAYRLWSGTRNRSIESSRLEPPCRGVRCTLDMSRTKCPHVSVVWKLGEAVGILVVRTSDSRPEGQGLMSDATKYPPSTHGVRVR